MCSRPELPARGLERLAPPALPDLCKMRPMSVRRIALVVALFTTSLAAATVEQVAGGGTGDPGVGAHEIRFVEPFGVAFDSADRRWCMNRLWLHVAPARRPNRSWRSRDDVMAASKSSRVNRKYKT